MIDRRLLAATLLLLPTALSAQVTNGSFENGLTGWTVTAGSAVEALQGSHFVTNPIPPADGNWLALLSTGPGDIAAPGGDFDANGVTDFDGSAISTTFSTTVADEALSLQWAFLTDEVGPGAQGDPNFDDLFVISIDGVQVVTGSVNKPGGSSPFPDTAPYDDMRYTVNSPGATDGSDFGTSSLGGRTGFFRLCIPIANPGLHTLDLRVADQGDAALDSGLIVDAVEVTASCDSRIQVTASSGSLLEVKGGNLVFTQVENGPPATTFDGATLAFRSNGDPNGDNPNLQEQIWVANRNGTVFDIVRVTSQVGARMGDPGISRRGDWLVFSSTGDLVPGGNVDGNAEIFRHDVATGALLQITTTTTCSNDTPTVNENGTRIAFVSDCAAAGDQLIFWDGTARDSGTSGCTNRLPSVSRDTDGRYVTFLTNCGSQYAGVVNPDGGNEVVQWDTWTDLFLQVTHTPSGFSTDLPSGGDDGRYIALVSTADFASGQNPTGDLAAFRYDRLDGTYLQLTPADPLSVFTAASIDGSGQYVAVERLDVLTSAFEILLLDATQPATLIPVSAGGPSITHASPVVATGAGEILIAFVSNGDFTGNNTDLNNEIWSSAAPLAPPSITSYCRAPDLTIPDRGTVNDTLTVTDIGTITDLDVFVKIRHDWVGDLRVILRHVDTGVQRRLIERPGRPPGFGCSGDDIETTLDDEAATSVQDECVTPGPVAILGSFAPRRSLSIFDGEELAGEWRLTVSDRSARGSGVLTEWCLIPSTP